MLVLIVSGLILIIEILFVTYAPFPIDIIAATVLSILVLAVNFRRSHDSSYD